MSGAVDDVEARTDRVVQAAVGIALLGAFVFGAEWAVPVLGLLLVPGAVAGPRRNLLIVGFDRFVAPRLPTPESASFAAETVRAQDLLTVVLLAVATIAIFLGLAFPGWMLVIATAVVAVVAATTRIHLGQIALRRLGR